MEGQFVSGAVASLVADRAVEHNWEGLFQYAFIRTGVAATHLLAGLEKSHLLATAGSGGVCRARARVYAAVRALVLSTEPAHLAADAREWWSSGYASLEQALVELRRRCSRDDAEVLELRFSRLLSSEEIALVMGRPAAEVIQAIERGRRLAEELCGKRPPSRERTPEGALLEAFALDARRVTAPPRPRHKPVLELGEVVAGRYELEELLGSGAFADVYRARDREVTDHVVALKILRSASPDAGSVRAALRELQLIASVLHPSVVQLKDHGWHDAHLWFVMPRYEGETLAMRLRRGPLERREARAIFEALAEALAAMHRAGVLHQDIKPANVFLATLNPSVSSDASRGRVLPVLLDLGVAAKDAELVLAGTPAFFAPEVAARFAGVPDPSPVGPKSDVFSLALTLRAALDPNPPDKHILGTVDAFVEHRARRAPEPPVARELKDLRASFERWLHFSPDRRPSAEQFSRELAALTSGEERAARRLATMRWAVPSALAVLATFGAATYGLSREASLQRLEAERARERATEARARVLHMSASLSLQEARGRDLEANVTRLDEQYRRSQLTREQLAAHLAESGARLIALDERSEQQSQRLREQSDELEKRRIELQRVLSELESGAARREELAAQLAASKSTLEDERTQRNLLSETVSALGEQVNNSELLLARAELRIRELRSKLGDSATLVTTASASAVQKRVGSNAP
jgi:serine/threonine protein kinase